MTDRNEALRLIEIASGYTGLTVDEANQAAALLRQQAERIAELEGERGNLLETVAADTTMLFDLCAERDRLRAEVERLRVDAERYQWLRFEHQRHDPICHLSWKRNGDRSSSEWVNTTDIDTALDHARTTHKDEG